VPLKNTQPTMMKLRTKKVIGKSGVIDNFFTEPELDPVIKYLSNLKSAFSYGNGIDANNSLYPWFVKKCFNKIQETFGKELLLNRVTYLNDGVPISLHSDYYQMDDKGIPKFAMLIPISVNNDRSFKSKVHTVIFNEVDEFSNRTDKLTTNWNKEGWYSNKSIKENNAMQYKDEHLGHLSTEDLECLTVHTILEWKFGSLIYWDSSLLHTSDNFTKNNVTSKQALVLHTYVL